jgi:hypothetical protein
MVHFTIYARPIRADGDWLRHRDRHQNDTLCTMAGRKSILTRTIQNGGSSAMEALYAVTLSIGFGPL